MKDPANRRSKSFPLALEVLFPVIFPRHSLIGLNHHALADCQQTRLVLHAAIELTKPVKERGNGWNPERIAGNSQTSIRSWLTDIKSIEHEYVLEGSGKRKTKRLLRAQKEDQYVYQQK